MISPCQNNQMKSIKSIFSSVKHSAMKKSSQTPKASTSREFGTPELDLLLYASEIKVNQPKAAKWGIDPVTSEPATDRWDRVASPAPNILTARPPPLGRVNRVLPPGSLRSDLPTFSLPAATGGAIASSYAAQYSVGLSALALASSAAGTRTFESTGITPAVPATPVIRK